MRLAPARPSTAISRRPSGVTNHSPKAPTPTAIEVNGPTTAMSSSWRGVRASPSIAVAPPRKWSVIDVTWKP